MKIPKNHVLPTKTAQKIAVFVNKQKKNQQQHIMCKNGI
jgi:hypothetical protein